MVEQTEAAADHTGKMISPQHSHTQHTYRIGMLHLLICSFGADKIDLMDRKQRRELTYVLVLLSGPLIQQQSNSKKDITLTM